MTVVRHRGQVVCDTKENQSNYSAKRASIPTYDVRTDALVVDGECLHSQLHTIEARRSPHEVDDKVAGDVRWHPFVFP